MESYKLKIVGGGDFFMYTHMYTDTHTHLPLCIKGLSASRKTFSFNCLNYFGTRATTVDIRVITESNIGSFNLKQLPVDQF